MEASTCRTTGFRASKYESVVESLTVCLILSNDSFAAGDHSKTASFLVNDRRGAARLLRFGMNGPIHVARKRNDASSWLLVGADMVCSADTFQGSGRTLQMMP